MELKNLVDTVFDKAGVGRLRNSKFFFVHGQLHCGGLFLPQELKVLSPDALVLLLRMLEMMYGMTIHVIHISRKRMIAQGTDGCSSGSLMEGVMAGADMLTFVDLS
jgi:hypothetical protein